ncbi:MAG: hypothetical protein AABZ47_03045 [Planctomycetota bacterium]
MGQVYDCVQNGGGGPVAFPRRKPTKGFVKNLIPERDAQTDSLGDGDEGLRADQPLSRTPPTVQRYVFQTAFTRVRRVRVPWRTGRGTD